MKDQKGLEQKGFTIMEILVASIVFAIMAISALSAYVALQSTAILAKHKSISTELATNQVEYLKSLPYDSLAVVGGAIYHPSPLPNTTTQVVNGYTYTVKTSINYVDDAFDGCGSYPTQALKDTYCKNQPAPTGAPGTDLNRADYKIANVKVYGNNNKKFAELDTQVSARVAETSSTTGALIVKVADEGGNPISGASVRVRNVTITPNVDLTDSTDASGYALFYNLPPDVSGDYSIEGSKSGYSSVATVNKTGALNPTFPSQAIFTQQASTVTLIIKPMKTDSLIQETTDTSGSLLGGVKISLKGGYKKYQDLTNKEYYFDNFTPNDIRGTVPASGIITHTNLVPGEYYFCGDNLDTGCKGSSGSPTYYLAAAIPYVGSRSFGPINVPELTSTSSFINYGGVDYMQKARLILTTDSLFPRIKTMNPSSYSLSSGGTFGFDLDGYNLNCMTTSNCPTSVTFVQGANTYTSVCDDQSGSAGYHMDCTVDLSGASTGMAEIIVSNNGRTLTVPQGLGLLGGVNVTP